MVEIIILCLVGKVIALTCRYYVLHPGDFVYSTKYLKQLLLQLEEAKHHILEVQLDLQHLKLVITYSFQAILQTVSEDI